MSLGKTPPHEDLFKSTTEFCEPRLAENSLYALLHRESQRLFPDEAFADLFEDVGRRSVPPRIVATVMVLQRVEGLSDREAVERFSFDLRWKYAAGGLDYDFPGFVHTVLVDMRSRLRRSERPDRIFEVALEVCKAAGLVGRKRVLDSTALYDAVATQDTVTLIRSAIRQLLKAAGAALAAQIRSVLKRDDDYVAAGKPACDWNDAEAREALVDALARDAYAALACLDNRKLTDEIRQAGELVATVVGQDLEQREDGLFRIARRVAPDRVISTVDPEARHGHKTSARGFDGYKGHISIDPDSEVIVATEVTPANVGDGQAATPLLTEAIEQARNEPDGDSAKVYGDACYGTAEIVEQLEGAGIEPNVKVQPSTPPQGGLFSKSAFDVDLDRHMVRCPQGFQVPIRYHRTGKGKALFGQYCPTCPLRHRCTGSKKGREIQIHKKERTLQRARRRQRDSGWKVAYRATRPKVERKLAHMMRKRHGGRRVRVRGTARIRHDFALLAAATNLKRLAVLQIHHDGTNWTR